MTAYVVVDIKVTDPETYQRYIEVAPSTIEHFGGRYIARGGTAEKLEGAWEPNRVVVLEFESVDQAKAWWSSEEYRGPKALRQGASHANMIVVQGL